MTSIAERRQQIADAAVAVVRATFGDGMLGTNHADCTYDMALDRFYVEIKTIYGLSRITIRNKDFEADEDKASLELVSEIKRRIERQRLIAALGKARNIALARLGKTGSWPLGGNGEPLSLESDKTDAWLGNLELNVSWWRKLTKDGGVEGFLAAVRHKKILTEHPGLAWGSW